MARRYYSSTAVETTLSGAISNSATSITVTALSGFPNTTPWTAIIDADTASEELVEVTNVAGTTLTVTRGVDGTAAVSHNAGASFRHGVSARDFDEANDHVNDSTGVHGIGSGSSVVGTTDTQTLTNKTIDIASNTLTGVAPVANPTFTGVASFPDGSASAPSITNTGDTNTGLYFAAADSVSITAGGADRLTVNATTSPTSLSTTPLVAITQVAGVTQAGLCVAAFRDNANISANLEFVKSDSSTVGTNATLSNNDRVSGILSTGADGTGFVTATEIRSSVDGVVSTGDVPGRVGIFTKPVGGTIAERMRIDSNGLITGTGTSLGAWTAYTPTLGGTGWAIGDGTASGAYCQIGKLVAFWAGIDFGSTSTFGASNAPEISLPVTAKSGNSNTVMGRSFNVAFRDGSLSDEYRGHCVSTTTNAILRYLSTNGNTEFITATAPFTWDASDFIFLSGTYEAA